jgi:hypothetical protein
MPGVGGYGMLGQLNLSPHDNNYQGLNSLITPSQIVGNPSLYG